MNEFFDKQKLIIILIGGILFAYLGYCAWQDILDFTEPIRNK
tara:strand:+ start:250 stop:375 length:126 start_codon:yes stop_codon:yes gene_type:complete